MLQLSGAQIPGGQWLKTSNAGAAPDGDHVQVVANSPVIGGGCQPFNNLNLGNTGQMVKGTPGQLYDIFAFNNTAGVLYLKVYNKATAASGSDTPARTFPIPANGGINPLFPAGWEFAAGISVRCVTEVADNGTTSPATNGCVMSAGWK